jgi:flagellar P-ring protein precursor FlgI
MIDRCGRMLLIAFLVCSGLFAVMFFRPDQAWAQVRLRDLVTIEGVRGNQLVGYGLVIGLQGTGDTLRNSPFTQQSLNAMLERMGVNVKDQSLQTRNTAAVVVTATLPAFARQGSPIDVQVSSLGDSKSLQGGILMVTPLLGADGEVYAVSQGSVIVGGITVAGQAQAVREGTTTSGRVPNGGTVEREVANRLDNMTRIRLALRNPDFTTAERIQQALNAHLGPGSAVARDLSTVDVTVPPRYSSDVTGLIANIEQLEVESDMPAKVVIDEKSGTIVVGADVTIDTVAVTHGNLSVTVTETPQVSQPGPLSNGQTVVVPRTDIDIDRKPGSRFKILEKAASLRSLIEGLNALGLGPRDMIQVLNALKAAGALHADLEII